MNWESLNSSDKDKYKKIIAAQIEKEEAEFKVLPINQNPFEF